MEDRIAQLVSELKAARDAYYNLSPILTDQEYDAKRDLLHQLDPDNDELKAVGAEPIKISVWQKIEHEIPMGSLNKVNSESEFRDWAKTTNGSSFLITHKIDGSSLAVIYENGKLVQCISRGDGKIGELITENAVKIPNLPKILKSKSPTPLEGRVIVRGEVVMLKDTFKQFYAKQYANPRNTAAGKIRDKKGGGEDCKNLRFLAYTILCDDAPITEFFRFSLLEALGFDTPFCAASSDTDVIVNEFNNIKNNRDSIPYEIDGVVVRVNNIMDQEGLGEENMRPNGQIAWKFDPAMMTSRVIDVKWGVGLTGRLTCVAIVEPINIGGVTITNVSLHNLAMFNKLKLFKGCKVLISRRSDVIPYLESNLDLEEMEGI